MVFAATFVGCSTDGPEIIPLLGEVRDPIVNGELDSGDPAVVHIDVGCSGTLVSPKVVLTACHCMDGASIGYPEVFFGSNVNQSGTWIETVHHEVMNPSQCIGSGDIAMVTLAEVGPATPIPFNDRPLSDHVGEAVRLVGFGVTGQNAGGSGVKRQGHTKLHELEGQGLMWVGGESSNFCYGDSGGPNFMMFDGVEHVAGVTSFVQNGCGNFAGDGAARVDTYVSWVRAYIDEHDPADCGGDGRCAEGCGLVDPDCPCAADGFCDALCDALETDPDCDGCGAGDVCRADCPVIDGDCCIADDDCLAACGDLDPDCHEPEPVDPGGGEVPGTGDPSSPSGETGDGGLVGEVVCSMPAAPDFSAGARWAWLAALCGLIAWRRPGRRRSSPRPAARA